MQAVILLPPDGSTSLRSTPMPQPNPLKVSKEPIFSRKTLQWLVFWHRATLAAPSSQIVDASLIGARGAKGVRAGTASAKVSTLSHFYHTGTLFS
jgi:hypothetical protein